MGLLCGSRTRGCTALRGLHFSQSAFGFENRPDLPRGQSQVSASQPRHEGAEARQAEAWNQQVSWLSTSGSLKTGTEEASRPSVPAEDRTRVVPTAAGVTVGRAEPGFRRFAPSARAAAQAPQGSRLAAC